MNCSNIFEGKKVIIFDMDGTLIDSVGIWNEVDRELIGRIRRDGSEAEEDWQAQRDSALRRFSRAGNPYMEYCAFLREKYRAELSPEQIHELRYRISQEFLENMDYKPGAAELIRALKARGFALVIASTTRRGNMDIYRGQNPKIRAAADIDGHFDRVFTREDVREIKPHPEVYRLVLRELDASPEECLVFEDSLIGVEAAKAAGLDTVAVYDRYSDAEREQINALADCTIDGYDGLLVPEML